MIWPLRVGQVTNATKWKYLELTSIQYPNDDLVGKALALISQLPIWIVIVLICFIVYGKKKYRRRLSIIVVGLIINEVVNKLMKNYIKEPRPYIQDRTMNSYGMPSSHAQFMAFFMINSMVLVRKSGRRILLKMLDLSLLIGSVVLVCLSRTYLSYHSYYQVYMGLVIGTLNGIVWLVTNSVLLALVRYTLKGSFKQKMTQYW